MNFLYILIVVGIFIGITLWIGQSLWIYLDSKVRKDRYAVLWGLLALFSVPVPLIVYLIVTRGSEVRCKNCGAVVERRANVCTNCGKVLGKYCGNCGQFMEEHWNYCPNCKSKYENE